MSKVKVWLYKDIKVTSNALTIDITVPERHTNLDVGEAQELIRVLRKKIEKIEKETK